MSWKQATRPCTGTRSTQQTLRLSASSEPLRPSPLGQRCRTATAADRRRRPCDTAAVVFVGAATTGRTARSSRSSTFVAAAVSISARISCTPRCRRHQLPRNRGVRQLAAEREHDHLAPLGVRGQANAATPTSGVRFAGSSEVTKMPQPSTGRRRDMRSNQL
jgi:hypothetical protein